MALVASVYPYVRVLLPSYKRAFKPNGKDREEDCLMEERKPRKKKEMTITMKSEPLKSASGSSTRPLTELKRKSRDYKKKGTRGSSWIG